MRAEGTGDRVRDGEFAERTHDEVNRNATDDIRQEHRWAGEFDSGRRSQKQTDADRAAKADELDMSVFQAAFQVFMHFLFFVFHNSFLLASPDDPKSGS